MIPVNESPAASDGFEFPVARHMTPENLGFTSNEQETPGTAPLNTGTSLYSLDTDEPATPAISALAAEVS